MEHFQMIIDGQSVDGSGGEVIESTNPYSEQVWATVARGTEEDVNRAVEAADRARRKGPWGQMTATARGALMRRFAEIMAEHAQRLAEIEVRDNGKLLAEMGLQLRYIPQIIHYFAGLADKVEGTVPPIDRAGHFTYTRREPVGVVAAITPWNSPLMLATSKIMPALAAGCTVVLKPSEFTSASTIEFAKLFKEAGFPDGVVNVVTGFGKDVGSALTTHPKVAKVSFTGSDYGGRAVYEAAAKTFKTVTLELGGKSPNIVFDDCVMEDAVKGAVSGIFAASGQTCIAGSRLLVQRSIHDQFVERLLDLARTAKLGDPMLETTQVGPITTPPQYEKVLSYLEVAKGEGAEPVLGGNTSDVGKWFVEPTILTGVNNNMRIAREEVFGPVLGIIPFEDEEEAIEIANDTIYGLASGVWTQSMKRAFTMANALEAGTVWVNTYRAASFTTPFGGYKNSGVGSENGISAVESFLKRKSVWINYGADVPNPFVMRIG
ncbi:MAG: carnitine dehydratase [Ahrensia sp.]|nr:carnitine dehydratase [Ahrensia sp.]|tara:strand:- start:80069 stop:81541 length:1473 start_codon:yes stop_codon:yes gene_type:complete